MKCPNCRKDIVIPERTYMYLESYKVAGSTVVASQCCGAGFTITMQVAYTTKPYIGTNKTDDWGTEITKTE